MCRNKAGLTLIELIMSISLLGIIILVALSVELSAHRFFLTSQKEIEVINRISPVMEHIQKNISRGIGCIDDPGLIKHPTEEWIKIRIDDNDPPTPQDFSDDTWVAYRYIGDPAFQIRYHDTYPQLGWPEGGEIIAENVVGCDFKIIDSNGDGNLTNDNLLEISLTGRYNPAIAFVYRENPEVKLRTRVLLRSMSIN